LVWEVQDHGTFQDALHWAVGAAFEIHKKLWFVKEDLDFSTPVGMGIGIACGEVVRVLPETYIQEMNEPDLLGYPMNAGSRLQELAGPYGVVLDSRCTDLARKFASRVLGPQEDPIIRHELRPASEEAKQAAQGMKGLSECDCTEFMYVVWPHVQNGLWRTDGRI
jgi:class 3 adenylate cyclase